MGTRRDCRASTTHGGNGANGMAVPMTESPTSISRLKAVVESQHGGAAILAQAVSVQEVFDGQAVWEGTVHVFDLEGHPSATRAYAWSSPIEGSTKRRFYAVLHLGGIRSPLDAVRAAIVAEARRGA